VGGTTTRTPGLLLRFFFAGVLASGCAVDCPGAHMKPKIRSMGDQHAR